MFSVCKTAFAVTLVAGLSAVGCQSLVAAVSSAGTPLPTDTPSSVPTEDSPTLPPSTTPTVAPTETPTQTPTPPPPEIIGPDSYPEGINPLTGLPVDDPALLDRRPLLIKISNAPPVVRPQSGTSYADLIVEHYAEGGWTRFSAIFYSRGVDHIGSVRSVRLIDLELAPAYDALVAFSGGSLGVVDMIRESSLYPYNVISPHFGYGQPYFVRFPRPGLATEHTMFTNTEMLWQWAEEHNVRRTPHILSEPGMAFCAVPPEGGIPASVARLDYARTGVMWRYDPLSGRYLRWTDGVPHTDALTGEQLAFSNVIVISAYHEEVELFPEKYGGEEKSLYIELQGEGPATLLRDGLAYEGRWHRANDKSTFTFTGPDGEPLLLKPGTTFFQVIRVGFEELFIEP